MYNYDGTHELPAKAPRWPVRIRIALLQLCWLAMFALCIFGASTPARAQAWEGKVAPDLAAAMSVVDRPYECHEGA